MYKEFETSKKKWAENIQKYDLIWPDESVVRFFNKSYNNINKNEIRILDFGCGSGRNAIAMALSGLETYAIDYNEECINISKKKAEMFGVDISTKVNEGVNIPYNDKFFDCVVAWGSAFYNEREGIEKLLKEINRVIKKDGLFFANWRSKEDYFFGRGKKIAENTFILDESNGKFGLEGKIYYFISKEELEALYESLGFEIYNFDKRDYYTNNLEVKNSHWHVWARKK